MSIVQLVRGTTRRTAEEVFDDFWKAYPRRVAKKEARKAWSRIKPEVYEQIFAALETHKRQEQWMKDGGAYIPYPATWLNGERWEDEVVVDYGQEQCGWNRNGTREPGKGRCSEMGKLQKGGVWYCAKHGAMA